MRNGLSFPLAGVALLGSFVLAVPASANPFGANRVEAVKGKRYELTKDAGPWMIMVASLRAASPDGTVRDGLPPDELADELVYELRHHGIPAYVYSLDQSDGRVSTTDRIGRQETRRLLTHQNQVCVLAGEFDSLNDPEAQKGLKQIKAFHPQCMEQNNVTWLRTRRRKGPLGGAFLAINPLLSPEEVRQRKDDPLLKRLNSGAQYSLLENPKEYTLVVATFTGKTYAHLGDGNSPEARKVFQADDDLYKAAHNAWELAAALRELENIDAYEWHGRYESLVAVGGFNSPNDPRIQTYEKVFGADPQAARGNIAQVAYEGRPSERFGLVSGGSGVKVFGFSGAGKKGDESRMWLFDPQPRLMRVPRLK